MLSRDMIDTVVIHRVGEGIIIHRRIELLLGDGVKMKN